MTDHTDPLTGAVEEPMSTLNHPYNRDHACLGCQYGCACRDVPLICDTCGKDFPSRSYNGHDLAFCSAKCDPVPVVWTALFVQHAYVAGCCDVADYMHMQEPVLVARAEAARLGLGERPAFGKEPGLPNLVRHVRPKEGVPT